ncbi:LOW QUALITY PROTEIN: enzymatic polyprotein endonuclease reverse [Vespula squamosa]|uniref:Enzymatic polyprotein endonuclease reverse n=1 Tax=Vespula squamosa TaxID=30214 RepID=A0ABD2BDW6_VESSQ
MVPRYDGYNISISTFTRACKRARELIPERSEETLTHLIINRLSWRAYLAVENYKIRTVNRLCDVLREEFGRNKTLYQYKAELSKRVKDLHQAIYDEERYKMGELMEDRRRETAEFALTSFCEGLPLEYRLSITPDTCEDLLEAFAKARKFYSEIGPDDKTTYNRKVSRIVRLQITVDSKSGYAFIVTNPGMLGRNATNLNETRREKPTRWDYPPPPRLSAPPHRSYSLRKECRYCKNIGHIIEECRKKMWQDKKSGNAKASPEQDATLEIKTASGNVRDDGHPINIRSIHLNENQETPSVIIFSKDLKEETTFLVDTGSEPNILKIEKTDDYLLCNEANKIKVSGITNGTIITYGSCTLDIYGHPVEFHLVPNSFPIPHGGILEADFFRNSAKINFTERNVSWKRILMPFKKKSIAGRTCDVLKVNILNNEVKTGYIPALNLGDGIYAGEAIVTYSNG